MPSPLEKLIAEMEPRMRAAFLASIRDITSAAQLSVIARAIEEGRIDDVMRALHLSEEFFAPLDDAIRAAYLEGGRASLEALPALSAGQGAGRLAVRFNGRHHRAEQYLAAESSRLIVGIVTEQRNAIRAELNAGLRAGRNPRNTALDIVGRVNRLTGRREGGLLGLTPGQQRFVSNARAELASGDPDTMARYFTRTKRDKRFDATVRRAIREGRPVASADVDRITGRYADRLLKLRGDTIARTETLTSMHAGQQEAMRQVVETGAVRSEQVRRIWRTASDSRVRDAHQRLDRESVGLEERFSNGLLYPGEPGGPAAEVINCRCALDIRIDFLANLPAA